MPFILATKNIMSIQLFPQQLNGDKTTYEELVFTHGELF
jgi:hypothetical protein